MRILGTSIEAAVVVPSSERSTCTLDNAKSALNTLYTLLEYSLWLGIPAFQSWHAPRGNRPPRGDLIRHDSRSFRQTRDGLRKLCVGSKTIRRLLLYHAREQQRRVHWNLVLTQKASESIRVTIDRASRRVGQDWVGAGRSSGVGGRGVRSSRGLFGREGRVEDAIEFFPADDGFIKR